MITLYLASRPLDISALDIQLIFELITGLGERSANYSLTTELPNTPEVERLVGIIYDAQDDFTANKIYKNIQTRNQLDAPPEPFNLRGTVAARLEADGLTVFEGRARITQATGRNKSYRYELELIGDNMRWLADAGTLNLQDLQGVTVCYSAANISDVNDVYCFPFIEYGNFTNNMAPATPQIDIENLYPALFVRNLVIKGFGEIGYQVKDRFFVGDLADLIIPFTNDKFRTVLGVMESEIAHYVNETDYEIMSYSGSGNPNFLTETDYSINRGFITYDNPLLTEPDGMGAFVAYISDDAVCGNVHLCFRAEYGFTFNDDVLAVRTLSMTAQIIGSFSGVLATQTDLIASANQGVYNKVLEFCGVVQEFEDIYIRFTARIDVSPPGVTPILDPAFSVVINYSNLTISHSLIKENFLYEVYKNAPNITFKELIANITRMFNLVITTEQGANVVTIQSANDFFISVEEAATAQVQTESVDWSGKLDLKSDRTIYYPSVKDVSFSYAQDSDALAETWRAAHDGQSYGDYVFDTGGTEEEMAVTVDKFAASQSYKVTFAGAAYSRVIDIIQMVEPGTTLPDVDKTGWQTRILFFDRQTPGAPQYWILGHGIGTTSSVQLSFPLCYFVGDKGDLTFEALFSYYRDEVVLRTMRKHIEVAIMFTAHDAAALDFGRPVWLGDGWYRLQKVNGFNPNRSALTRVELRQI